MNKYGAMWLAIVLGLWWCRLHQAQFDSWLWIDHSVDGVVEITCFDANKILNEEIETRKDLWQIAENKEDEEIGKVYKIKTKQWREYYKIFLLDQEYVIEIQWKESPDTLEGFLKLLKIKLSNIILMDGSRVVDLTQKKFNENIPRIVSIVNYYLLQEKRAKTGNKWECNPCSVLGTTLIIKWKRIAKK